MSYHGLFIKMKTEGNKPPQAKSEIVSVTIRFITLMQRYTGQREIRMEVPTNPDHALKTIIKKFQIPWNENLEKSTRIFINKELSDSFIKSGKFLNTNDVIAFIPISGGG